VNPTAFGILALKAAGLTSGNSHSAAWLRANQNQDGGWGFASGAASDPDSTGAVLQALAAAGGGGGIRAGVGYLRGVQRSGGGFALTGGPVNAQSTSWAAQGVLAAGASPSSVRSGGRTPLDYLASVQAGDGHYRYSSSSDQTPVWVTGQALMAVNGAAFPLAAVPRQVSRRPGGAAAAGATAVSPEVADGAAGGASQGKAKQGAPATTPTQVQAPTSTDPVPLAPSSSGEDDGSDGGVPGWLIVLVAAALLAAAAWGGWILYRRRLPG
jgi:hypothetical protein